MTRGSRIVGVSALCCAILAGPAWAAYYIVSPDPTQPEGRVGAACAEAASGDTIGIQAGIYFEHIDLDGKSLTIVGLGGAASTILDGSHSPDNPVGSIFCTLLEGEVNLKLSGVTLQNGRGLYDAHWRVWVGGAIAWTTGTLEVDRCTFRNNHAGDVEDSLGGAIHTFFSGGLSIENCVFVGNEALDYGGSIAAEGTSGDILIDGCSFRVDRSVLSQGDCLYFASSRASVRVGNCTIDGSEAGYGADGIYVDSGSIHVTHNSIIDHVGDLVSATFLVGGSVELSDNVFANIGSARRSTVAIESGSPVVTGNTFVSLPLGLGSGGGTPLVCSNNIVAHGDVTIVDYAGGLVSCNDFWDGVQDIRDVKVDRDISADPMFCFPESSDYAISWDSPCAAEHSPPGCGLIGALPEACRPTQVQTATWGQIKARFGAEKRK